MKCTFKEIMEKHGERIAYYRRKHPEDGFLSYSADDFLNELVCEFRYLIKNGLEMDELKKILIVIFCDAEALVNYFLTSPLYFPSPKSCLELFTLEDVLEFITRDEWKLESD